MSLGRDDLVLCAGTMGQASFADHVIAASEAGFGAISLYLAEIERARAEGLSDADMKALLDDHGVVIAELDPLLDWVPDRSLGSGATGEGAAFFQHGEADFYAVADALGGRSLNAVLFADGIVPTDAVAEAFAGVCDRAAEHGLLVHLEYLPWTQIRDLRGALEIAELAGRANGGVMVDSWHHFRGGGAVEALARVPGERILGVQLNDAPRTPAPNVVEETLHHRLLPGAGAIDLVGLVQALDAAGSTAPIGVEVFSDDLFALPAKEVAQKSAESVREILRRARD